MSFVKHPFENNKDLEVLQMIENQWKSKRYCSKNYHRALKKGMETQKLNNKNAEIFYHAAIEKIKLLHASLPNRADRVIIEMNLKTHPCTTDELYSICFSACYFDLACDIQNNYFIQYKMENCPLQTQIMELFKRLGMLQFLRPDTKIKDYKTFFKRALQVQPERFITLL
ncbi:hypothetical protein ACS5PU_20605 [Pedobacter sp. GSP4]|uniref:hypothetical protein n=1 Tax=Pedobacter sp. GSP4 TaxID=3453716 RepID=UPI003EECA212